mmetsp:Transcript_29937/g.54299  ORF Transcript_29937/g.54299 Transcript_29937/m.54299 type:complete len:223 (+) Transcript_29937:239-907(+)
MYFLRPDTSPSAHDMGTRCFFRHATSPNTTILVADPLANIIDDIGMIFFEFTVHVLEVVIVRLGGKSSIALIDLLLHLDLDLLLLGSMHGIDKLLLLAFRNSSILLLLPQASIILLAIFDRTHGRHFRGNTTDLALQLFNGRIIEKTVELVLLLLRFFFLVVVAVALLVGGGEGVLGVFVYVLFRLLRARGGIDAAVLTAVVLHHHLLHELVLLLVGSGSSS